MATKRVVLLFAGQGAQAVGMGRDLAEQFESVRDQFARADEILGFSLSDVMSNGPAEELTRTSRCQPALYVHGMALFELLRDKIEIAGTAGLSLGEFTAHAAAGTFDFETGLKIVAQRGSFMEEATNSTDGTMAAMIGGDEEAVRNLAAKCDVDVANFNAPGQIVLSGTKTGIAKAIENAKAAGIKMAKELDVAGAYHSRLMMPAQVKLAKALTDLEIQSPGVPVLCNVEAREVSAPDDIRRTLEAQVSGSVRWTESMQEFLSRGETTFLELGPGGVLAGLMKRIDRSATVISATDVPSLEAAVSALAE
ncbi:MAG: ACP S-malonyltransferase [Verrucomicrobiales bacterium]|nr:ACP S-malonyltransferase [Verrucomicrobiales bacterium]